jgi:DNA modification methylase
MVKKNKQKMKIKDLKPAEYNPRKITGEKLAVLKKALVEFGDLSGIVYNRRARRLIGGHQRIKTFNKEWEINKTKATDDRGTVAVGYVETPHGRMTYREVDWPEAKEKAANIAANQHGGEFDEGLLKDMVQELKLSGADMDLIGFDAEELSAIFNGGQDDEPRDAEPKIDQAEELNKKWQVKPGNVWQIGEHRLLCGDSTKAEDVERVLGGGQPFMMVTDPPYGVEYDASWRLVFGEHHKLSSGKVINDERARWNSAYIHAKIDVAYVWHGSQYAAQVALGLEACGLVIRSQIIWKKTNMTISRGDYHWGHEACWYAVKKGATARFVGGRKQKTVWADILDSINPKDNIYAVLVDPLTVYAFPASATTIWELPRDKQCGGGCSTQKPLECMARPIRNHGAEGDIVYDPFIGSGTTMVACENLKRKCRGIELSPAYCAVILQRMTDAFLGIKIKRVAK